MKLLKVTIWRRIPGEPSWAPAESRSLASHSAARAWALSQLGTGQRTIYQRNTDRWAPWAEVAKRRTGRRPTRIEQPTYRALTVGEAVYW